MSLITDIKISCVTNLSDARYCAGMGVNYLGFNLVAGHESYISPEIYGEITSWISGPAFIGEFEDMDPTYIREVLSKLEPDGLEVTRPEILKELSLTGKPLNLKLDMSTYASQDELISDLNYALDMVEFFIMEQSDRPGLSVEDILPLSREYPILLGFGFDRSNILEILERSAIRGIAMKGEKEEKVGFKDYDMLADILEILESDQPE